MSFLAYYSFLVCTVSQNDNQIYNDCVISKKEEPNRKLVK